MTWEEIRERVNALMVSRGEWAGAPMPIEGLRLTIEPRYPCQGLNGASFSPNRETEELQDDKAEFVNKWYSFRRHQVVWVYREDGATKHFVQNLGTYPKRYLMLVDCLAPCGYAWSVEAETKAMEKLRSEITERAFECYMLSGSFLETSKRSGITYLFRRLRPTIALGSATNGDRTPIVALCMHPIGYYEGTFFGAMVPTDDVLAHLLMMRGDEHGYWKKANQHPLWSDMAGI